jgi:hypothetical protein
MLPLSLIFEPFQDSHSTHKGLLIPFKLLFNLYRSVYAVQVNSSRIRNPLLTPIHSLVNPLYHSSSYLLILTPSLVGLVYSLFPLMVPTLHSPIGLLMVATLLVLVYLLANSNWSRTSSTYLPLFITNTILNRVYHQELMVMPV